jgi:hypothetical protein
MGLKLDQPVPLTDVDQQRRRLLATGEVERATLFAVEARDLPRFEAELGND